jgi:4-hydroxy-tetrahydrodipicolinate synthase
MSMVAENGQQARGAAQSQAGYRGVVAPIVTPFNADLSPDAARYVEHARWLMANGCTGLAPFGTTGEANSLSGAERKALLEALVRGGVDPRRLLPGTGCCSLSETAELSRHALELGCAGVMTLPPFYYKGVSDDGLFAYFGRLIETVADNRLRIYLYHIPPVAQVGFSVALVGRLIEAFPETIVGLKDSSGDWGNTEALLKAYPGFGTFAGSEVFLLQDLRGGGVGCITATGNVNPAAIRGVYEQWRGGEADTLQAAISATRKTIQQTPMIPSLKYIIGHYRKDAGWRRTRPPFVDLPEEKGRALVATLEREHAFRFPL